MSKDPWHLCNWPGCKKSCAPVFWGCTQHWFQLPERMREAVRVTYVPGQEQRGGGQPNYMAVEKIVHEWAFEFDKWHKKLRHLVQHDGTGEYLINQPFTQHLAGQGCDDVFGFTDHETRAFEQQLVLTNKAYLVNSELPRFPQQRGLFTMKPEARILNGLAFALEKGAAAMAAALREFALTSDSEIAAAANTGPLGGTAAASTPAKPTRGKNKPAETPPDDGLGGGADDGLGGGGVDDGLGGGGDGLDDEPKAPPAPTIDDVRKVLVALKAVNAARQVEIMHTAINGKSVPVGSGKPVTMQNLPVEKYPAIIAACEKALAAKK